MSRAIGPPCLAAQKPLSNRPPVTRLQRGAGCLANVGWNNEAVGRVEEGRRRVGPRACREG